MLVSSPSDMELALSSTSNTGRIDDLSFFGIFYQNPLVKVIAEKVPKAEACEFQLTLRVIPSCGDNLVT